MKESERLKSRIKELKASNADLHEKLGWKIDEVPFAKANKILRERNQLLIDEVKSLTDDHAAISKKLTDTARVGVDGALSPVEAICGFSTFLAGITEGFTEGELLSLCVVFAKTNDMGLPKPGWSENVVTPDLGQFPVAEKPN